MAPTTKQQLGGLAKLNSQLITEANSIHAQGVPWGDIGGALGMTAQAASRRFNRTTTGRMLGGRQTTGVGRGRRRS